MNTKKKITINEIRSLVKQIVKEEYGNSTIKEDGGSIKPIQQLSIGAKSFNVFHISEPFKDYIYLEDENNNPYIDVNTILSDNGLLGAVWVKVGGKEEKIANNLDFLVRTDRTTKSGYNTYVMYNIK